MSEHWTPHLYQLRVVEEAVRRERLGLFLDPGLASAFMSSTGKETAALTRGVADIYIVNPEGLEWLAAQRWEWPELVAVDESTRFKRTSTRRSRHLKKILGAHPAPSDPHGNAITERLGGSAWADPHPRRGAALGATLKVFRETFCALIPSGRGYAEWEVRTAAKPEIQRLVEPLVIRLDARDYLDLSEKMVVDVPVVLPDAARGLYERLRKDLVIRLAEGDLAAVNAGVLTAKCRQVANGSVYLTEGGEPSAERTRAWSEIHTAKAQALADLVEELGKPLLVAYEHHHDLELIRRALRPVVGDVPHIGGGVSAERGATLERAWNGGQLRVLALHPQSAAHGLNLQAGGHHLAWYSPPGNSTQSGTV